MERTPGFLWYKFSKYADLESIPVMELFSRRIKRKLHENIGDFLYLLGKYGFTWDRMSFRQSKKALKRGKPLLFGISTFTSIWVYDIRKNL